MSDFSHLGALDVSAGNTAEYTLHQITVAGKTPVLTVAPATEANKPYFNTLLKRSSKKMRGVRAGTMQIGRLKENRTEDRGLYPLHIVKGWSDMLDAKGKEVKFSPKEAENFLSVLPDWIFDDLRNFCGDPANFTEMLDLEIAAKN